MKEQEERKMALEWIVKQIKDAPRWFIPRKDIEKWYNELDLEPMSNMFQTAKNGGINGLTEDEETGELGYYLKDVINWLRKNENINGE